MIDFRAVLTTLSEAGVRFIIVGGAAATAHGAGHSGRDVCCLPLIGRIAGAVVKFVSRAARKLLLEDIPRR